MSAADLCEACEHELSCSLRRVGLANRLACTVPHLSCFFLADVDLAHQPGSRIRSGSAHIAVLG